MRSVLSSTELTISTNFKPHLTCQSSPTELHRAGMLDFGILLLGMAFRYKLPPGCLSRIRIHCGLIIAWLRPVDTNEIRHT